MNHPRFDFDHTALRRLFVTPFLNSFEQFFLYARIDFQHLSSMIGSFYINNDNRVANRATAGRPYKEGGLQTRPYSSALHALCSLPFALCSLPICYLPSARSLLSAIRDYSLKSFPHLSSVAFNNSSLILVVRGNSSIQ